MRTLPAILISIFMVSTLAAQENGNDHNGTEYTRPEYKVFKSISAAMATPDSVFILELKGKKLREFPTEVFNFPNLVVLDLKKNKIKTIPASISRLKHLQELDLTGNKIEILPSEIGSLISLRKLSLNRNIISELPTSIGNLENLEVLELWDNELSSLPDEIKNLKKLRKLEMRGILFSDEQQKHFYELLPNTRIYMSPACDCKVN